MPRARVPHFEMCKMFKGFYEEKFGGFYCITPNDAKMAHEFWVLNGELEGDQLKPYCMNYFADQFEGWKERRWPAWLFWKHFNSFAPKIEQKPIRKADPLLISCSSCGQTHPVNSPCPEQRDVGAVITNLANAKRAQ